MIIRRHQTWLLVAFLLVGVAVGLTFDSLCATDDCVVPQSSPPERIVFEGASPDEAAPVAVLPDGQEVALDQLAPQRPVALVVIKGPWCQVCQRQLQALSARLSDVQAAGGAVFGLTTASPEAAEALRHKLGLGFPILSDPDHRLHTQVGLWKGCGGGKAVPGIVYLGEDGEVAKVDKGRYPGQPQGDRIIETLSRLSAQ